MSTLKSPPPQAFSVSDVHPRLRKCPPGCTLDCGFKTSESPALRGFEAERCPIRGTSLYLVLKSNGLPRPKIRLKKFGFSSKSVPANIAKKLPLQLRPKPLFIAFFNFSHKRPTFAFTSESGYTLAFCSKDRTQRLTRRNTGRFGWGWYHYSRSVPHVHQHPQAGYQNGKLCRFGILAGRCSRRTQKAFGTAMRLCVSLFRRRRSPAGLFSFVEIALVRPTLRAFYTCKVWGCYHCSRYALRIVKVFRAQFSKRLTFVPTLRSW
jgi:hypothetical protein